jgi:hypothetical protein
MLPSCSELFGPVQPIIKWVIWKGQRFICLTSLLQPLYGRNSRYVACALQFQPAKNWHSQLR